MLIKEKIIPNSISEEWNRIGMAELTLFDLYAVLL
jgi:hypothetical protein